MLASLTYWMEVALWVVLGAMAADFLAGLFRMLTNSSLSFEPVLGYLRDILYYIVPLLVLASLATMDTTGWIVLVGYYIGALAVFFKYLRDLRAKF
ncbi:hypothetical protein COLU111180_13810 [Cohnella lubricantis]|uniref:Uncharacterized protein n=1 Tax=Cohnella lubricantis TaxID=2163172 RepID=A0A841TFK5_9BACL|nr:hypothetical protein [Cohnella lubricantis]MBB6678010.1 hypothetical protein [Cohnella lubricantis]MBP2118157.1 putative membrane protein [Cohnella lubricantis]